jgi:hypothetical protein
MAKKSKTDPEPDRRLFSDDELPPISAAAASKAGLVPWDRPGQLPPKRAAIGKREYPAGESLARARKRLALTRGPLLRVRHVNVSTKKSLPSMTKLREARAKARKLGYGVQDEAFTDWIDQCVVIAQLPGDWTQAAVLYSSYIKHASRYGVTNADRAVAKSLLATETRWGKMMGAAYPNKVRRAKGWYYPVRPKRGA